VFRRSRTAKLPSTIEGFQGYDALEQNDLASLQSAVDSGTWPTSTRKKAHLTSAKRATATAAAAVVDYLRLIEDAIAELNETSKGSSRAGIKKW
jgi:hypothetical protein